MATTVATIATTALSPAISTSAVATATTATTIGRIPTSNATAGHVPTRAANHGDATTNCQCEHPAKGAWAFHASLVFHLHWLGGRLDLAKHWLFPCSYCYWPTSGPLDAEPASNCPHPEARQSAGEYQRHRWSNEYQYWWSATSEFPDPRCVLCVHWLVGRPSSCLGCVCALCAGCDYSPGRDVAESAPNGHHSA